MERPGQNLPPSEIGPSQPVYEDKTGGVWRCIIVFCMVSLMHGGIKKNRKEKYCGFCVFFPLGWALS